MTLHDPPEHELPINFRKSSWSDGPQNCLELALNERWAVIRDSKDRSYGRLIMSAEGWAGLLDAVRNGELDQ